MLTINSSKIKNNETPPSRIHSHCNSMSSLVSSIVSSSSLSSSAMSSVILKIENTQTSRFKAITKAIKSTATSFFRRVLTRITHNDTIDCSESSRLIGMTIHPKVARKYEGKINFNGTGKIKSVKKDCIKKQDYHILINNRIKPLNETPHIVKERIRTPGEAVVDIAGLLKKMGDSLANKQEIAELIKCTWLDGTLSRQALYNMAELIKIKISDCPQIIKEIDNIIQTLEQNFFVTKRNDNYYGRLFETELSRYIVHHPSLSMLQVRDAVSAYILDDFLKLSQQEQFILCNCLAERMYADPPAWRSSVSCATKFITYNRPETFIEMMKYSADYSVPLVLSTAVKYIISSIGTVNLKIEATEYYMNKILPQRQVFGSSRSRQSLKTKDYGLLLSYQNSHPLKNEPLPGKGIRPIDKYVRPTAGVELPEHDSVALSSERTIGIGMSGSSNILHFLFKKLQLQNEDFPMDDAKLATASWLSFSGGHSFNEAYSVFGFMSQGSFKPLSFNELKTFSRLSAAAIDHSYNKVVEASMALSA